MNPADPLTAILLMSFCPRALGGLRTAYLRTKCVEVPVEVSRQPLPHLEVGFALHPFEPDRRDLADRPAVPPGLGHELDRELEPCVGLDPDLPHERPVVPLERARRVVRAHPS